MQSLHHQNKNTPQVEQGWTAGQKKHTATQATSTQAPSVIPSAGASTCRAIEGRARPGAMGGSAWLASVAARARACHHGPMGKPSEGSAMVLENNPGLLFGRCMSHLPFSSLSSNRPR
eukprot:CAMPEP_0182552694 /NCGR_PEP_ID=MMETSP1323-20130603/49099_1 /TAXON_ID=236787 /ORGANISM="Florenciella parvula, Strain RCC1693" /LENGTH=117 /DNA_ID=CAMNT_0024764405 /DNA_START=3163 /DNA_END=3514 /DNA_ORIENTATION=-